MKKMLCVIMAVIIALSSMSIVSFAGVKVPEFTIALSSETAKVGDTVTVSVVVEKGSRLCAATIDLVYDNAYLQVESAESGTELEGVINPNYSGKRVRYTCAKTDELQIKAVLFTATFKVLKTNANLSLDLVGVCTTNSPGSANFTDVTSEIKETTATIACAHANKDTVVLEEPSCSKVGYSEERCKECDWVSEKDEIPMIAHDKEEVILLEPTCTEKGYKAELCKNCEWESEKTEIAATGHTEGEWTVTKAATTTEKGLKEKKCTVCGEVLASEEIDMLPPYTLGDVNDDGKITAVDARMILRAVAGLVELTDVQKAAADVNDDENVSAVDARLILQYVVGKAKF